MSNELIKAVRDAVIQSAIRNTIATRHHEIMRHGYEPIVVQGRLCDCIKIIIHATQHLIESGFSPNYFEKYLHSVSCEYRNEYHLYVFDELPFFDKNVDFAMAS